MSKRLNWKNCVPRVSKKENRFELALRIFCLISQLSPNRPRTPLNRALGKLPVKFYLRVLLHIQDTKGEYNNPEQEELVGCSSFELLSSETGIHRAMWPNLCGDNSNSLELYLVGEVMCNQLSFSPQIEWINKKTPESKSNSFFVGRLDWVFCVNALQIPFIGNKSLGGGGALTKCVAEPKTFVWMGDVLFWKCGFTVASALDSF